MYRQYASTIRVNRDLGLAGVPPTSYRAWCNVRLHDGWGHGGRRPWVEPFELEVTAPDLDLVAGVLESSGLYVDREPDRLIVWTEPAPDLVCSPPTPERQVCFGSEVA